LRLVDCRIERLERIFTFMATVLERFNALGLAHSNNILMKCGVVVADAFDNEEGNIGLVPTKNQQEGDRIFSVRDYPFYWIERMDYVIILWCANQYKNG